ncbi:MAG: PrsW family glutamic-type intramembrane protease [Ktedonobacteraceae bacterium]
MSAEHNKPSPDPNANDRRPSSELWGPWDLPEEDTQPRLAASHPTPSSTNEQQDHTQQSTNEQFVHREHVTGALPAIPSDAPLFRPAYQPYMPAAQPHQGQWSVPSTPQQPPAYPPYPQQGYAPGPGYPPGSPPYQPYSAGHPGYAMYPPTYAPYNGYPGYNGYYPYAWQPQRPKRDGFHLATSIIALVGSILAIIGGLASGVILLFFFIGISASTSVSSITDAQIFAAIMTFTSFILAGLVGGGFGTYHSIRAILQKPSISFKLPRFWIFVILYILVLGIGFALRANGQEVAVPPLTAILIILAGILPVLALLALGIRRLRTSEWTTNWRRFTLAITSGATLGIGLALLLELGFLILLLRVPDAISALRSINDPQAQQPTGFTTFGIIFLIVAVMGPVVEETVKPLAVAFFIGRIRGPAEAFALGMSAGMGFAIVETIEYISSGYHDWLTVALERTGAGLLHGFGAGMVALGWYYLIRTKDRRFLKAFACWAYAVFQHLVWNGTAVLSYLPDPYGSTLNSWNLNLGSISLPFVEILNIIEAVLIFVFFIYMTRRLRPKTPPPVSSEEKADPSRPSRVAVGA